MKSKVLVAVFTVILILVLAIGTVFAEWAAMSSGYAVTTNWHGVVAWPGEEVTAWAGTKDPSVTEVKFVWLYPNKTEADSQMVSVFGPIVTPTVPDGAPLEIVNWAIKYPDETIFYAISDPFLIPDLPLGDWAVKAYFLRPAENPPPEEERLMVRATSFNAVPETPWGPIAISVTLLAALGFFVFRKRSLSIPRTWN